MAISKPNMFEKKGAINSEQFPKTWFLKPETCCTFVSKNVIVSVSAISM